MICVTFGTRLADAGVDIVKIAELMGHQSILTTRRYTHATDQGKRAAIAQLASYRRENCHKFAIRKSEHFLNPHAESNPNGDYVLLAIASLLLAQEKRGSM